MRVYTDHKLVSYNNWLPVKSLLLFQVSWDSNMVGDTITDISFVAKGVPTRNPNVYGSVGKDSE